MPSPRRAMFLDVDGTLIDHDEHLAPSARDAVQQARAAGHLVFLCTGRANPEISQQITDIGFDGAITAAGGYVELRGELIAEHTMPAELLREAVDFFERERIEYILQSFDAVYPSVGLTERIRHLIGPEVAEWALARATESPDLRSIPSIAKLGFYGEDPTTFARVRDALTPELIVITGTVPSLGEAGVRCRLPASTRG